MEVASFKAGMADNTDQLFLVNSMIHAFYFLSSAKVRYSSKVEIKMGKCP